MLEALRPPRSGTEPERAQMYGPPKRETARRRKGEEAKGRPSHIGRATLGQMAGLRDDLLQCIIKNGRNTQIRSSKIKQLSVPKWSKFEHWFSHAASAILDMLRISDRTLREGTIKVPVSSPSGKSSRNSVDKTFQRSANRLQISRS